MPLLVSFVIEPELAAPTPPTPVRPNALPPLIVPRVSLVIVKIAPALAAPTPPVATPEREEPAPPVIAPPLLFNRLPIFAPAPLDTPAPPAALTGADGACGAAVDRAAVVERRDGAELAAPAPPAAETPKETTLPR